MQMNNWIYSQSSVRNKESVYCNTVRTAQDKKNLKAPLAVNVAGFSVTCSYVRLK